METKKDALSGVRLGALTRAVACILSAALTLGLAPSGAIAYAAERGEGVGAAGASQDPGSASSADRVNEDVPLDTSGGAPDEGAGEGAGESAGAGEGAAGNTADGNAGDADAGSPASASDVSAKYTSSANGQTSADVSLDGMATVGTIEYNGLAYTINADAPDTVAVTGLATDSPKGEMAVPNQIASGDRLYTVTKIVSRGGVLR